MTNYSVRQQCLEFAETYGHLPNVRLAVQYAHAGTLTWEQVYGVFKNALGEALAEVAE